MQSIGPGNIRTLVLIRDARRATRDGSGPIESRQSERLRTLVAFARSRSRYYQDLYRGLPERITDIRELPSYQSRPNGTVRRLGHGTRGHQGRGRSFSCGCIPCWRPVPWPLYGMDDIRVTGTLLF